MKSLRRQFAMYLIFIVGLIVGMWLTQMEFGWFLSVLGVPALIWFVRWDEINWRRRVAEK